MGSLGMPIVPMACSLMAGFGWPLRDRQPVSGPRPILVERSRRNLRRNTRPG